VLSVFCSPSRYTQGRNATASLGAEMTALGLAGPALIVAGSSAVAKLADIWRDSLGKAGIAYAVHRFGGECSHAEIARVAQAGRAQRTQVVVGAGGGKVLDTARAAAAGLGVPVVNCPTLASSDAPCSALSVIYTDEGEFQEYRFYGKNPDLVLVDTQVIAEAPPRLLVAGMGDALATWFEAKTCVDGRVKNMRGGAFFHGEKVAFGTLVQLVLEGQPRETFAEVLGFAVEVDAPMVADAVLAADATGRAWRREHPGPPRP
jgi:glycerol dehydrogenase